MMTRIGRKLPDPQGAGLTGQRARDRLVERLRAEGIAHPRVLEAMGTVPRHVFVDEALASRAYEDTALPIGLGQTISQPWVVARMTELALDGRPALESVLEVGTGSGYQAAVLAAVSRHVYSIERIDELLRDARRRFRHLGLTERIRTRFGDGREGWPEHAPFEAILVTAGSAELAGALAAQLAEGGVLVAPLGASGHQHLVRIRRVGGDFESQSLEPVAFVPLLPGVQA